MIALSWSRLSTFMQCPRKFQLQFITKSFREEEKGLALIRGEQLHKQMEDYVNAKNGDAVMPLGFSPEVRETIPYVDKLYQAYDSVYPEAQLATDINWSPVEWFAKAAAWRAIVDVTAIKNKVSVFAGDYKSGKIYPYGEGYGQLHLTSVIMLNRMRDVEAINSAYIYMEHKKITRVKVTREKTDEVDSEGKPVPHLAPVQQYFEEQFEKVQLEKAFEPRVNEYCKWCQATKAQCPKSRKL